jgi:hypothetical protein
MQVTRFPEDDFGRTHPRLVEPVLLDAPERQVERRKAKGPLQPHAHGVDADDEADAGFDVSDIGYQQNVGAEIRDVKTLEADVSR